MFSLKGMDDMIKKSKARCIKNGYMNTGRQFCIKGKDYEYIVVDNNDYPFTVKTEGHGSAPGINYRGHDMSIDFFHKYFYEIENLLSDELFEL